MRADPTSRNERGAEATPQLIIWLLGTFRVAVGTRVVHDSAWRLRRARNLIKLLALAPGHRLHREQVIEALWPELDAGRAANSLHQVLHLTRHTLQPGLGPRTATDYLPLRDEVIALCSTGTPWVDADAFAAAAAKARQTKDPAAYREALDIYAGILLPSDLYEDWAGTRRDELQQLYQTLLWELAAIHQNSGDITSAHAMLEQLVTADPLHEEAHVALMRVYASSGRTPQALRQYERFREALGRELGTQPAQDTQQLHEEILAGRYAPKTTLEEPAKAAARATAVHKQLRRARRAVAARPVSNLPAPLTSFVGREREKAEVRALLSRARLVTLTGIGGAGKTRLAIEVARDMLPDFEDGVWLVELAPLSDGTFVAHTLASTLNVAEQPGRSMIDTLTDSLQQKHLMLVLDNCEHLADVAASLAGTLLQACPRVHILATSRERLKVVGENIWRVPSLSIPDPQRLGSSVTLNEFEAIRLFVERGAAVSPEFALTERNAHDIVRICWQLDGLPLPIELAASRLSVLSPRQIADRLADGFRLLRTDSALVSARHQTLQAVMDWTYDPLLEEERRLFRHLSVFAGGLTLEATEAVYGGKTNELALIDLLTRLVDKSLIIPEDHGGEVRYRLLETVRQYGQERLIEAGEAEEARRRHWEFFLSLAMQADPQLKGAHQRMWLNRLDIEHDNLRTALEWSRAETDAEAGLRLGAALWRFWWLRGYFSEGRRWLEALLALEGSRQVAPVVRGHALNGAGALARKQGDYGRAVALLEEALTLFEQLGDRQGIASSRSNLAFVAQDQGDYERAAAFHTESLGISRDVGDTWRVAVALSALGLIATRQGVYRRAMTLCEEGLHLFRESGDTWGIAMSLDFLGEVAQHQGDHTRAAALYSESLALRREVGDKRGIAAMLNNLGIITHDQGDLERAAALYSESVTLARDMGAKWELAFSLNNLGRVTHDLGEAGHAVALYEEALALGRALGDKRSTAVSLANLGAAVLQQGDYRRAAALCAESLILRRDAGDKLGIALSIDALAQVACAQGLYERAAVLLGAAEALRDTIGAPLAPAAAARHQRWNVAARAGLGQDAFAAAHARGRGMPLEQALASALSLV